VRVHNKHYFTNLKEFTPSWVLREVGKVVQSGTLDVLDLPPQESRVVRIPFEKPARIESEYLLTVSFALAERKSWAPRGHVVAWDQFALPWKPEPVEPAPTESVSLEEQSDGFLLSGTDFTVRIGRKSGVLESFSVSGIELLEKPLAPNFWKVPNDNQHRNNYLRRLGAWRDAGPERDVLSVSASRKGEGRVDVVSRMKLPVGGSSYTVTYEITGRGEVTVKASYEPGEGRIPLLPKFGMQTALPARCSTITWYGRGPQETYQDRKTGGEIAIYSLPLEEFIFPYIRAQDNANRTDVRWVTFTDGEGRGIRFKGLYPQPLSVSAWPYAMEDLEKATHDHQLPRRDSITVNVDWKLHGVGGDNSWGARTHPEYTLPGNRPYSYGFVMTACRGEK
jgi:beta-galactosidase